MAYVMIVTDMDGHKHRIECATNTDLMNWLFKFTNDLDDASESDRDSIAIHIRKSIKKENHQNGD